MHDRRHFLWLSSMLTGGSLLGCAGRAPSPDSAHDPSSSGPDYSSSTLPSGDPEPGLFARATNRFGLRAWQALPGREQNQVISPASIELALAMTLGGARGPTARQMVEALAIGDRTDAFHVSAAAALQRWNDPARDSYRLSVANRLFGQEGYAWEPPFLQLTDALYGAPLESLPFRTAAERSRERINDWVEQQTEDRIVDLLPTGSIRANTRMVLANAVYFLGKWTEEFPAAATRDAAFYAPGGELQVPTMHQTAHFGYAEASGAQLVELPYEGDDLSMWIALPTRRDGLADLERALDVDTFDAWQRALEPRRVALALPKFRLEPDVLALNPVLAGLGMTDAFDPERADFRGIADPARNEGQPLYISNVFHKAFVEVDEAGTEAAAATAVVMGVRSAAIPTEFVQFRADHPFLFFIRDRRSGATLFMGRVTRPG